MSIAAKVNGQDYRAIDWFPHVNKAGDAIVIFRWVSRCTDCGAGFTFTETPDGQITRRRCDLHRAPRRKAHPHGA